MATSNDGRSPSPTPPPPPTPPSNSWASSTIPDQPPRPDNFILRAVSYTTFTWLNPILACGARKVLEMKDLFALDEDNLPITSYRRCKRLWNSEVARLSSVAAQSQTHSPLEAQSEQVEVEEVEEIDEEKQQQNEEDDLEEENAEHVKLHQNVNGAQSELSLKQPIRKRASLWQIMRKLVGIRVLVATMLLFVHYLGVFINTAWIQAIVEYYEDKDGELLTGVVYSIALLCTGAIQILALQHFLNVRVVNSIRIKGALTLAIYRKMLRLTSIDKGDMVTLISSDVPHVTDCISSLPYLPLVPLVILFIFVKIGLLLGVSVMAAIVVLFVLAVGNMVISTRFEAYSEALMEFQQKRLRLISEILQGMLVIKFFGWEYQMRDKVNAIRQEELKTVRSWNLNMAAIVFLIMTAGSSLGLATFTTYAALGHTLDAKTIFPALYLLGFIMWPLLELPASVVSIFSGITSGSRIRNFLTTEEIVTKNKERQQPAKGASIQQLQKKEEDSAITICNGTFWWGKALEVSSDAKIKDNNTKSQLQHEHNQQQQHILQKISCPVLSGIEMEVPHGALIAIIGKVGAGKSSLLNCLLYELQMNEESEIRVNGSVAYVGQHPWIQNATVKENILFTLPFDAVRYANTLSACALLPDLEMFPAGDNTEIGEWGINLSGGQKQRINMARAVYANKDIYLLDDPLSAVDAHVGKHLFDNCINGGNLLTNKTRILVTHQLQYLPWVDFIYVLEHGKITAKGTWSELVALGFGDPKSGSSSPTHFTRSQQEEKEMIADEESGEPDTTPMAEAEIANIIEEEERCTGTVNTSVYLEYLSNTGSNTFLAIMMLLCVACQLVQLITDGWLALHADPELQQHHADDWLFSTPTFIGGYVMFSLLLSSMTAGRMVAWFYGAYRASSYMHSKMLMAILRAPMSFYNATPSGRILNRFAKDLSSVDQSIPSRINEYVICVLEALGKLFIIAIVLPPLLLIIIPLASTYWMIQNYYRPSKRELTRLAAISISPVLNHLSESAEGVSVIRAFGTQRMLFDKAMHCLTESLRAGMLEALLPIWMGLRIQSLGVILAFLYVLGGSLAKAIGYNLPPSVFAIALSYTLEVAGTLKYMIETGTQAEAEMAHVERIQYYSKTPPEADLYTQHLSGNDWPSQGVVEFKNVTMQYRPEAPPALNDVSFTIKAREKVGIVGRTGAGKSSLIQALFRTVELSAGNVTIDGVDISKLGLHDLRTGLGIIPQDPVLFSGTLRLNMDLLNKHSDADIWYALEGIHMKEYVESQGQGLDLVIEESGRNLSVGQRQLLCMGRALLNRPRILVLDEATANVDNESDAAIQRALRSVFADSTVITIAHRLHTIIDADRILVLAQGSVAEYGTPAELLQNNDSAFARLVQDTGPAVAPILYQAAGVPMSSYAPIQVV